MTESDARAASILAEVLRLQRWAAGSVIPAHRIYGLAHGFETSLRAEGEGYGVTEVVQDRVEDMLELVEGGKLSPASLTIKGWLHKERIDETTARHVMELCLLQSRFTEGVMKIVDARGSVFRTLASRGRHNPEREWTGALHWVELVDCTGDGRKPIHAVWSPTVPRVGETVIPEKGSRMVVIGVEHLTVTVGEEEGVRKKCLVPHVLLVPDDADEAPPVPDEKPRRRKRK